jgi:hypothetical protein
LVAKERERQERHWKREESDRQQKCEAREKEREATEAQQRACDKLTVATEARGARKGVRVDRGVGAAKENEALIGPLRLFHNHITDGSRKP